MKQKLKNNQRGITLVALVITIIVLLILAMVSIKIAIDGGLIGKSNEAVATYNEAKIKESIQLAVAQCYMEKEGLTKNNLKQALKEQKINVEEDNINLEDKKVTINGKEYSLTNEERKWYELTSDELNSIREIIGKDADWGYILINEEKQEGIMIILSNDKKFAGVMLAGNNVMISYYTNEVYNSSGYEEDKDKIKGLYGWYTYGGSGLEQIGTYEGDCPINLSDFDTIPDGCEDFVQRIINSF